MKSVKPLEETSDGDRIVTVWRHEPTRGYAELSTCLAVEVVAEHLLALATVPET